MLVIVTVALAMLIEIAVVADYEDAAASSCWAGGARNVLFVGLLQVFFMPQQAHQLVIEL